MVKRLKKLTVEEAQTLPEDAVILLQDGEGNTVNLGYRDLFQNSGPNRGRWGWVLGQQNYDDEGFAEIAREQLDGPELTVGLKGRKKPLFASFEDKPEYEEDESGELEDQAYAEWYDSTDRAIRDLPAGSIVESHYGTPLGLKLEKDSWIATGCIWTSDQDAEEKFFTEDISIVTPEADSQL